MISMQERLQKRIIALFIVGIMLLMPAAAYAESLGIEAGSEKEVRVNDQVYHISTAEDFARAAEFCKTQNYSTDKTFILDADIDISEYPGLCIPYMDGVFDGRGHKISGILLQVETGEQGLFRYIGKSGAVINLTAEGELVSSDELTSMGILCGVNYGLIRDCTVYGVINAHAITGGICGLNEENAVIRACCNEAQTEGRYQTGGIAGKNDGLIADCENKGDINTSGHVKKRVIDGDGDAVRISVPDAVVGLAVDDRANETGGIVGYNTGRIIYCDNNGIIGAKGLGSSSGGIAGRSAGSILSCENTGSVYGRAYVGGITGYLDPLNENEKDKDYIKELEDEIDEMSDAFDSFSDAGEKLGDNLSDNADRLKEKLDILKNTVRNYSDGYDRDIDTFRYELSEDADDIEDIVDEMDYKFRFDKFSKYLKEFVGYMAEADEDINTLEKLIAETGNNIDEHTKAEIDSLLAAQKAMYAKLNKIYEQLKNIIPAVKNGELPAESVKLPKVEALPSVSVSGNFLTPEYERAVKLVKQIDDEFEHAKTCLYDASVIAEKWPKEAKKLKGDLKDIKNDLKDVHTDTKEFLDSVGGRTDAFRSDLRPQSDAVSDEMDNIREAFDNDWDNMAESLERVTDCFSKIRETLKNGRKEIRQIIEDKTIYVDVSGTSTVSEGEGKLLYCSNSGEVNGKTCVGGIVGGILIDSGKDTVVDLFRERHGFEFEEDEEDDEENEPESFIKHVAAYLYSCINVGDVYADSDYAAGIAGKADYGLIQHCENYADISIDKGNYAGGIAGKSDYIIKDSYSLGGIESDAYAGGIAGKGKDITECYSCMYPDMDEPYAKAAGAIAGKIKGNASGNYFVDNGIGAVDGVTLSEEAIGMKYKDFMKLDGIPQSFSQFKVRFVDQDQIIWEKNFKYGEEFTQQEYPVLEAEKGEYAYWEKKNISPVVRNVTIHSVRRVYMPSVAAQSAEGPSSLVIEGEFYPDSLLAASEVGAKSGNDIENAKNNVFPDINYVITKVYEYEISQSEKSENEMVFHVNTGGYPANSMIVLNEQGQVAFTAEGIEMTGHYLVAKGIFPESGTIILIEHVSKKTVAVVIVGVLIMTAMVALAVWMFKRKEKFTSSK